MSKSKLAQLLEKNNDRFEGITDKLYYAELDAILAIKEIVSACPEQKLKLLVSHEQEIIGGEHLCLIEREPFQFEVITELKAVENTKVPLYPNSEETITITNLVAVVSPIVEDENEVKRIDTAITAEVVIEPQAEIDTHFLYDTVLQRVNFEEYL